VNALDAAIFGLALGVAVAGYRIGFVTRVLSWAGAIGGLVLGARLLPLALTQVADADQTSVLLVAVGLLLGMLLLGQGLGYVLGEQLRPPVRSRAGTALDGALGALASVLGVLGMVWILLPLAVSAPGWLERQTSGSWISRQIEAHLPAPPDASEALRVIVGEDRFPTVFATLQPPPDLGPPPADAGLSPELAQTVRRSVVKVEALACRRIQSGTGFVVGDDLVVTNAHVVAGSRQTTVALDDGSERGAQVVGFDPARDLALLSVRGLDAPVLARGAASPGQGGGVFGHPGGGPLRIAPFSVDRVLNAIGRDIYDAGFAEREVLQLHAALAHGDSGSPVVRSDGRVIGVVFAISTDRASTAYALSDRELEAFLAAIADARRVSTGPCLR
jgi:S1-C subfamily serine protease